MNENMNDENHHVEDGLRYRAETNRTCVGCAFVQPNMRCTIGGADRNRCIPSRRLDGRSVIWVRDDQPAITATADSAPDGTVPVRFGPPAPVLRLTPPVDAADLARTLTSLRPGKRLVVSVEDGCITVREVDNG